jgi:hypothetical protein
METNKPATLVVAPAVPFDISTRAQAAFEARPTITDMWERAAVARVDLSRPVDPTTTSFNDMHLRSLALRARGH